MPLLSIQLLKLLLRSKSVLLGVLLSTLSLGIFSRLGYQNFLYLQAQNLSNLSVFNEIILPLSGLAIVCQITISILVSVHLYPQFSMVRQTSILSQSSIPRFRLLITSFIPFVVIACWPLINFIFISLVLNLSTELDSARLLLTSFGLLLVLISSALLIYSICVNLRRVLFAVIIASSVVTILLAIESLFHYWWPATFWKGIFFPFIAMREGMVSYADLIGYLGWLLLAGGIGYLKMTKSLRVGVKGGTIGLLSGILLVTFAGYVPGEFDVSVNQRSRVSEEFAEMLKDQKETLEIIAVIDQQTSREEILRGLRIIRQVLPDSQLEFRSRQSVSPELQQSGEYLQFILNGVHQSVSYPFEQDVKLVFESAILQILQRKRNWVSFIEGHGESSIFASKPSDIGEFSETLKANGWSVTSQNLSQLPLISDNTGLLIIASSQQGWMPGEVELVMNYLHRGGNLLLLADPESIVPSPIESFLGISRFPGTLVDWNGYQSGTPHPAIVVVNEMTQHPAVKQLNSLLAFPWASGLIQQKSADLSSVFFKPIVVSHKGVWNEFNIEQEELAFNQEKGELQRPFVLAMSRFDSSNNQKIIVVGDSHFLSDSAINNYANKQFALNLISWLTNSSELITSTNQNADGNIKPLLLVNFIMNWGFSFLLPLIVLLGWFLYYRRYRAFNYINLP